MTIKDGDAATLVAHLPQAGNNGSIAVGFSDESALKLLGDLLREIFHKASEEEDKNNNKREEKANKLEQGRQKVILERLVSELRKIQKQNEDAKKQRENDLSEQKETADSLKEFNKDDKAYKKYILRALNVLIDGLDKHLDAAFKVGGIFQDLESNGVFLKNGFNELGQTAYKLGMTYDDLANHLKKTSPLIAKLNGYMGNGLKTFESAIDSIDDRLNLSNSEKVAAFESWMSKQTPDQLQIMSQEQMNNEINRTAKELKMMSLVLGKNVELVAKENAEKEKTARHRAWQRSHQDAYNILYSSGLWNDEDIKEFITTGGTKITPKMLMKMQNDPFAQQILPELARLSAQNQLNTETFSKVYQKYNHLAGYKTSYANRASMDPAHMMAAGISDLYEDYQFYAIHDLMENSNFGSDIEKEYYGPNRKNANKAQNNMYRYKRNRNSYEDAVLTLESGGEEGVGKSFGVLGSFFGLGGKMINGFNEMLGGPGLTKALIGAIGASSLGFIGRTAGDFFFSKAVNKFDRAVDRFSGSGGSLSFFDNSNKFSDKGLLSFIDGRTNFAKNTWLGKQLHGLKKAVTEKNYKWFGARSKNLSLFGDPNNTVRVFSKQGLRRLAFGTTVTGGLARGMGLGLVGEGLGAFNDSLKEKGTIKQGSWQDNALNTGSKVAKYAGVGMTVGSLFGPGIGTAVGAGIGALAGLGVGAYDWYKSRKNSEINSPENRISNNKEDEYYENNTRYGRETSLNTGKLCDFISENNHLLKNFCSMVMTKGENNNGNIVLL